MYEGELFTIGFPPASYHFHSSTVIPVCGFADIDCKSFPEQAASFVDRLKTADITEFKAKDVFRASALSLLGISNLHVEKDREKIRTGKPLSPLLLVRDTANGKVVIADGYHRMCAIYEFDEDAWLKCKIV